MPPLSVYAIRASLIYFLLGATVGAALLAAKAIPAFSWAWMFLPAHIEWLLLGFVVQLTMGVAYWILPRLETTAGRGPSILFASALMLLNAGVVAGSVAPFQPSLLFVPAAGRCLEGLAVIFFVIGAWPRIYPYGRH